MNILTSITSLELDVTGRDLLISSGTVVTTTVGDIVIVESRSVRATGTR